MRDSWRRTTPTAPSPTRIFTEAEKQGCLVCQVFGRANLDGADFSGSDLRAALFENTSLRGCNFSTAHLIGTEFLRCDLRGARFAGAKFERNSFDGSWFLGASGLSESQRRYLEERGGLFLCVVDEKNRHADLHEPASPQGNERNPRG